MSKPEPSDSLLELHENLPATVYVRYFPQTGAAGKITDEVGFALEEGGTYHRLGIHWHNRPPSADTQRMNEVDNLSGAKFLSLVLEPPVIGVDCDLHYSPKTQTTPPTPRACVMMCVPSGDFKAEFHFVVSVQDAKLGTRQLTDIDPKIVVTPITHPGM
jgi:hypothetical protein